MKKVSLLLGTMFITFLSFGQIKGKVVDGSTKEVLVGATITSENVTVVSGQDGSFELKTAKSGQQLTVSFLGYTTVKTAAKAGMTVELNSNSIGLQSVAVFASIGIDRKTPVALSNVNAKFAAENLGSQELPELLKVTPSAFITKAGGGYGDSRINIRGFDSKNIGVLINGVPINDMEGGTVYFSNWAGIGDALKSMQVQRGLGASKLAISSVGGTMNIITKTTDAEKGGSIAQSFTDYGQVKTVVSLSTGNTKRGAFSFVGSTTQGYGYVNNTNVNAYSYFLSYSKDLGTQHKIQFTAIGAPQEHGQRSSRLTPAEYAKYGLKYNKDTYVVNGNQERNININYFHKPIFSLNDYWTINDKTNITTSVYASFGHGGGSGAIGSYDKAIIRNDAGQLMMDQQVVNNQNSTKGSLYGIRNSVNNHSWYGILSTLNHKFNNEWNLTLGVDARTYKGEHFREMRELIGGAYYADPFTPNATVDPNSTSYYNVTKVTPANNRIAYDNDGKVGYAGTFGQIEYATEKVSTFLQAAISQTGYQRIDRYNFSSFELASEKVNLTGYNVKTGANYNIDDKNNVYVNIGTYSRAPYFSFIFNGASDLKNALTGNTVNKNIKNEEANAFEIGYGYRTKGFRFKFNGYFTEFKNRSLTSPLLNNPDGTQYRALITGQGAIHKGVELNADINISKSLDFTTFASFGDWKWKGNASATLRDDVKNTDTKVDVYSDGLMVGDQPQIQVGGYLRMQVTKQLDAALTGTYNDKYYAYYNPSDRTTAGVTKQPYRLPAFGVIDARIGYKLKIGGLDSYAQIHVYNLMNENYWVEANDAGGSAVGTLGTGFKGWGRNADFSVKINF